MMTYNIAHRDRYHEPDCVGDHISK